MSRTGGVVPSPSTGPVGRVDAPFSAAPRDASTTYPRLLRTRRWRWWQAPLGLLILLGSTCWLILAAFGVVAGLGSTVSPELGRAFDEDAPVSEPAVLLVLNAIIALGATGAVLAVVGGHQERPGWLVSVTGLVRWRLLGRCAVVAALTVALSVAITWGLSLSGVVPDALPDPRPGAGDVGALLLVIALTTPLQATGEEVVFRGYLTQAVAAYGRSQRAGPLVAAAVTSPLFVAGHLPVDTWIAVDLTAFALVASWVSWRTGGLEAAIALHVVNNVLVLGLAAVTGTVDSAFAATELPWPVAVVDVAGLAAYAVLVARWAGAGAARTSTDGPDPRSLEASRPIG